MKPQGAGAFFHHAGLVLTFGNLFFSQRELSRGRLQPRAQLGTAGASERVGLEESQCPTDGDFRGNGRRGSVGAKPITLSAFCCKHVHPGLAKGPARWMGSTFSCCGYFPVGAPHGLHEPLPPPPPQTPSLPIPRRGSEKALFILI